MMWHLIRGHRGPLTVVLTSAIVLLCATAATAQTVVNKHVRWNVDPLVGHTAGPYLLNFQLVDGAGIGNSNATVTVSNAPFAGFTFNNSAFIQMFSPSFTPLAGVPLEFDVSIAYPGTDSPTPDQLSFAALDNLGFELPTLGPADALATFDVTSGGVVVNAYGSDTARAPEAGGGVLEFAAPVITDTVPEPGALFLFLPALAVVARLRRGGNTR